MAADLDMDTSGGEGWGDDAELQLDEGKFRMILTNHFLSFIFLLSFFKLSLCCLSLKQLNVYLFLFFSQMASWMLRRD